MVLTFSQRCKQKGHVLHRARAHLKVRGSLLVWNALLPIRVRALVVAIVGSKQDNFVQGVFPLPPLPKWLNAYNRHFENRQGEGPGDEIVPSMIRPGGHQAQSRPQRRRLVGGEGPRIKKWVNRVEYLQ